jgi:hypothetical protein
VCVCVCVRVRVCVCVCVWMCNGCNISAEQVFVPFMCMCVCMCIKESTKRAEKVLRRSEGQSKCEVLVYAAVSY